MYRQKDSLIFGWFRGNEALADGKKNTILNEVNTTRLTIHDVEDDDKGVYICTAITVKPRR